MDLTAMIMQKFKATKKLIKACKASGVRVVRHIVNEGESPDAVKTYKKLFLSHGYDNRRTPGAVPEYVADAVVEGLWHALSGAKRAAVWEEISTHHPDHKRVKAWY